MIKALQQSQRTESSTPVADDLEAYEPVSIQFTEDMHGILSGDPVKFRLTITHEDVWAMVNDPQHPGVAEGTIQFRGETCQVKNGHFDLFSRDDKSGVVQMRYLLPFRTKDGASFVLDGTKVLRDDRGFDVWEDSTTLFTRVMHEGRVVAEGTLRLNALDLARQLTTFRTDADSLPAALTALGRFFAFFGKSLFETHVASKF